MTRYYTHVNIYVYAANVNTHTHTPTNEQRARTLRATKLWRPADAAVFIYPADVPLSAAAHARASCITTAAAVRSVRCCRGLNCSVYWQPTRSGTRVPPDHCYTEVVDAGTEAANCAAPELIASVWTVFFKFLFPGNVDSTRTIRIMIFRHYLWFFSSPTHMKNP